MAAADQGSTVPQFLTKVWLLVEDSGTDDLICWGLDGKTFIVLDQPRFAKEVLPLFFKHNNMASFVRQLNMYGFRKKTGIDQGSLKSIREDVEFIHPHFIRGQPEQLELIKRKVAGKEDPKVKPEEVKKILNDVRGMKVKQHDISGSLEVMKRENQALWSEVMVLRQRHEKQQKIVNRLIQFLLTLVNPVGLKRKQLAIEPSNGSPSVPSRPKYSKQISLHGNLDDLINLQGSPVVDSNIDNTGVFPVSIVSDLADNGGISTSGVTVSELTSPTDPKSNQFLPGMSPVQPNTHQVEFDNEIAPCNPSTSAPNTQQVEFSNAITLSNPSTSAWTNRGKTSLLENIGDLSTVPISDVLTPMTRSLVPGLDDISSLPISEILCPTSLSEPSSSSMSEPIVTSPLSVDTMHGQVDGFDMSSTNVNSIPSMELVPREGNVNTDAMKQHILQRALSAEDIEQKEQLGSGLLSLQANIDSIQQLLSEANPSFAIDPDMLLGSLFDFSDPDFNPANITGTEMIEYNPDTSTAAVSLPASSVDVSDEDSLLESLTEDSKALARDTTTVQQEEID